MMKQLAALAEQTHLVATSVADEPQLKSLCLEGVSLTLKDVNLTLPSQKRDKERELKQE
jgi:hypothetical protein